MRRTTRVEQGLIEIPTTPMQQHDSIPDYGTYARIAEIQAIVEKGLSLSRQPKPEARPYSVYDCLGRTSLGHGLSEHELRRLANGLHFLERYGEPCLWVILGDGLLDLSEHEARKVVQAFTSQIVKAQKRAGLEQYWLRVHESTGGFHSNLVFPAYPGMDRDIRRWGTFADYLRSAKAIRSVYDFDGLTDYLAKERPPNVKGGWQFGRRKKGSHKLGAGGGDRVQLSQILKADAIAAGVVEPWQRTKAKVLAPSGPKRRSLQPSDLRSFRQVRGYTQAQVSRTAGIRNRSHVANFERGHDRLSPHRQRLLKHMMDNRRTTA